MEPCCRQEPEFDEARRASSRADSACSFSRLALFLAGVLTLVAGAGLSKTASAQESWVFSSEIPCESAPVYGVPFSQCWISNTRTFRIGTVQGWRLAYTDSKSEFSIGFYRIVDAHGVGGMSPVSASATADWVRTADALKNVTAGASNWASSQNAAGDRYVTYQKPQRQCIAFVRNGPITNGQVNWILGAAFCRESAAPLSSNEAQFIADAVKVRD
jgi:hypothetical protein